MSNPQSEYLKAQKSKSSKTSEMTNKEWLEELKRDGNNYYDNEYMAYRQAKALEIIAEELIKLRKLYEPKYDNSPIRPEPEIKIIKRKGDKLL
jgi:hypothetical protein